MTAKGKCCCGSACPTHDCLNGSTIDTGCCPSCDTLILFCERPGYTQKNMAAQFNANPAPGQTRVLCCEYSWSSLPPVQAIYRHHGTFYRVAYRDDRPGLRTWMAPYPECPFPCPEEGYSGCENCDPSPPFPNFSGCVCNSTHSQYQLDKWTEEPGTLWGPEMICWGGGANLTATLGRLEDQLLGIVHFERWWKIADPKRAGCAQWRIHVPDCTETENGWQCGDGAPVQGDNLVPKWWIYACSGVPLFDFDITDAVNREFITTEEASDLRSAAALKEQPIQDILIRMSAGGYFDTKDWRAAQRQAFVDLNGEFPGAGYAACVQNVADMDALGPVRRRLCGAFADANPTPILDLADATATQQTINVDGACFIDYPGLFTAGNEADYAYWADRQWVYFRAVPGGWTWAGWNAPSGACLGWEEEEAILAGCGRQDPDCIQALKGFPLAEPTITTCTHPCWDTFENPVQCSCFEPDAECAVLSLDCPTTENGGIGFPSRCDGNNTGTGGQWCDALNVAAFCGGIRFAYTLYKTQPVAYECEENASGCCGYVRYECGKVAQSFLIEAQRTSNSWDESIPFQCRPEIPPLPANYQYPGLVATHQAPTPLCTAIMEQTNPGFIPNPEILPGDLQSSDDLCCGGFCPVLGTWSAQTDCCGREKVDCEPTERCPPEQTAGQVSCIGHDIECNPPEP